MYCNKCGSELDKGANFCQTCGAKVESDETIVEEVAPAIEEVSVAPKQPTVSAQPTVATVAPKNHVKGCWRVFAKLGLIFGLISAAFTIIFTALQVQIDDNLYRIEKIQDKIYDYSYSYWDGSYYDYLDMQSTLTELKSENADLMSAQSAFMVFILMLAPAGLVFSILGTAGSKEAKAVFGIILNSISQFVLFVVLL